jgi:hypothetical protein
MRVDVARAHDLAVSVFGPELLYHLDKGRVSANAVERVAKLNVGSKRLPNDLL